MKIFEFQWTKQGEKEWVAANNVIHALKFYGRLTDMDLTDFEEEDNVVEIPESEWEKYTVKMEMDEDAGTITFKEWIKLYNGPDIIAGTMYE